MTPITATNRDEALAANWREWLAGYFDGGAHVVAGASRTFPAATISFDQAAPPQPLNGVHLTVAGRLEGQEEFLQDAGQRRILDWDGLFITRCALRPSGAAAGDPHVLCRRAHTLLCALLESNTARLPLARTGLRLLEVKQSRVIEEEKFATRTVRVLAEVDYVTE